MCVLSFGGVGLITYFIFTLVKKIHGKSFQSKEKLVGFTACEPFLGYLMPRYPEVMFIVRSYLDIYIIVSFLHGLQSNTNNIEKELFTPKMDPNMYYRSRPEW